MAGVHLKGVSKQENAVYAVFRVNQAKEDKRKHKNYVQPQSGSKVKLVTKYLKSR